METEFKKYQEKIKKEFINLFENIKTFKDITDDLIIKIVDYVGYEGFNYFEDGVEYLKYKIEQYKNFTDPVILYRIIAVKNKKTINKKEIGQHYVKDEWMIDGDFLLKIGSDIWDEQLKPYIIKISVPLSEIDIKQTIIQNLNFPTENEINLKNNPKGLKILKIYKF